MKVNLTRHEIYLICDSLKKYIKNLETDRFYRHAEPAEYYNELIFQYGQVYNKLGSIPIPKAIIPKFTGSGTKKKNKKKK